MASPATLWEDPQCAFQVECSPETMDRIRLAVVEGLYALPRGGLEIGGVLLGKSDSKLIRITDWVAMECEHLTGPSFALSEKDEAALEHQLAGLSGQAVGWFHSHTRSDISFSPGDVAIHDRFFPEPWQVGLVLKPDNLQPLRANYFFRSETGTLIGGSSEFLVEAGRGELVSRAPKTAAVSPDTSKFSGARKAVLAPRPPAVAVPQKPLGNPTVAPSQHPVSRPAAIRSQPSGGALTTPPNSQGIDVPLGAPRIPDPPPTTPTIDAAAAIASLPEPSAMPKTPPRKPVSPAAFERATVDERAPKKKNNILAKVLRLAAILSILAIGATAYMTRESWMPHAPEPLKLQASDVDGRLLIRWTPVRDGSSGQLHVKDGDKEQDIALDGVQLSRGVYLFHREAVNDTVHLKVGSREDTTSFAGPLPAPAEKSDASKEKAAPVQKETKVKTARSPRAGRRHR